MSARRIPWRRLALPVACAIIATWLAWPEGTVTIRFDGWKEGTLGRKACFTVINDSSRRVTLAETYVGENPYWAIRDFAFKWKMNELFESQKLTINTASEPSFWNGPPAPMPSIAPNSSQSCEVELWEGVTAVDFAVLPGFVWSGWDAERKYWRYPSQDSRPAHSAGRARV